MRLLVVLSAVAAALAIAPSASPGGWATVGFEPLPDGTSAGGTWSPTIFVKQHGVTPLAGLTPVVDDLRRPDGRGDEVHRDGDVRGGRVHGRCRLPRRRVTGA